MKDVGLLPLLGLRDEIRVLGRGCRCSGLFRVVLPRHLISSYMYASLHALVGAWKLSECHGLVASTKVVCKQELFSEKLE